MLGIDVVYIPRMRRAAAQARFSERVFTPGERAYAAAKADVYQTLAGIFAAKEAVIKTFRLAIKNYSPLDIEILHDSGIPSVRLGGRLGERYAVASISIAHDGDYAVAIASSQPIKPPEISLSEVLTAADVKLTRRRADTNKGDYGRVKIIGGSAGMIGAPYLSSLAALKGGAGLVNLCVPRSLAAAYQARVTEQTLTLLPDRGGHILYDAQALDSVMDKADCIAIGMGMGRGEELPRVIEYLCAHFTGTLVIDADGLNALSENSEILTRSRRCNVILTPHRAEFARLYKGSPAGAAAPTVSLASELGCVVVNKSDKTIISDGVRLRVGAAGTPALAKGGSGDVLTGLVAALAAATDPFRAACMAVWYFGRAGEYAAKEKGNESLLASEIPDYFKKVFLYET